MKLFNINIFVSLLSMVLVFASCESLLDENKTDQKYNDKIVWANPILAEGVLLKAYRLMPSDYSFTDTYGTDDAVTNVLTNSMISMATGGATSRLNSLNVYEDCYLAFLNINSFLENMDKVENWAWKGDGDSVAVRNALYRKKLKGEAHALRAWWGARLLQYHGGMGANDILLGYPIVLKSISDPKLAKLPRNTYAECVNQIFADCDIAIDSLPLRWTDAGLTPNQRLVIGARYMNRINGISVMALKSSVALLASSPAFKDQSGVTSLQAAQMAANVMAKNGGITGLAVADLEFYKLGYVLKEKLDISREVLWYASIVSNSSRELNFYPPSLSGKAQINPSQNLVDAFPDKNGYPIKSSIIYSAASPYTDRDPRLKMYITYNGTVLTSTPVATINTVSGDDAIGVKTTSSRTGYYMRKLLDETVKVTPGAVVPKPHSYIRQRYTEVLLNFAEAANAANPNPDAIIGGFSARGVINALRTRAGITSTAYVATLDQAGMTELIKNERRIELCFEGSRFWDLRRWMDTAKMNETVMGINAGTLMPFEVEKRVYEPYMIYPPIPYSETLIYDIIQNKGW